MTNSHEPLDELFWNYMQLATQAARQAFLADLADRAPSQASELQKLIAHQDQADRLFGKLSLDDQPSATLRSHGQPIAGTADFSVDGVGDLLTCAKSIGPYKLLEPIGEGGMGVVYLAQQFKPVRRKVALKIIKPGMDSKQVIARFEAERQALAMMEHPNIARALDAGTTESGLPYFVMELVRGIPMNEYCDAARMSITRRLNLFCEACAAIQHAHNKGVIHRDIKPSNVLVTEHDGTPVVKVIDFGVAKALTDNLTDKTLFTGVFQMIGTPLYMSPEQASLSSLDVDTRSDVYSLGVMLYELVSGTLPIQRKTANKLSFEELRQRICDTQPPRPSRRLSTLKDERETIARHRGLDTNELHRFITSELDWIVMKSIDKDRSRRYQSPSELACDINRLLSGELVRACPPTASYRAYKFVRAYRSVIATIGLVVIALLVGSAIAVKKAIDANRAERLAKQNEQRANLAAGELRELLYAQDMTAASGHYLSGDFGRLHNTLDRHTGESGDTVRGFEWWFLNGLSPPQTELLFSSLNKLNDLVELPSGRLLVADSVGQMTLIDRQSGSVLASWQTPQDDVLDVDVLDSDQVVTCGKDGSVLRYRLITGSDNRVRPELIRRIEVCNRPLESIALDTENWLAWVGSDNGIVHQIDLRFGHCHPLEIQGLHRRVKDLEFCRDLGLMVGNNSRLIHLPPSVGASERDGGFDASKTQLISLPPGSEMVRDVEANSATGTLVVGQLHGLISVGDFGQWVSESAGLPQWTRSWIENNVHSVAIDASGQWIAVGDSAGHLHLLQFIDTTPSEFDDSFGRSLRRVQSWKPHDGQVRQLHFLASVGDDEANEDVDSRPSLASVGSDGQLFVSHPRTSLPVEFRLIGGETDNATRDLRVMCAWATSALASDWTPVDRNVQADAAGVQPNWLLPCRANGVGRTFFLADGKQVIHAPGSVLWRAAPNERAVRLGVSADGSMFALCIESPSPRRHRLDLYHVGQDTPRWTSPSRLANDIVFSPHNDQIAYVYNNDVRIVSVTSGKLLKELRGHSDSIQDLAFDHTGNRLASVSSDRKLIVWDVETSQPLWSRVAHRNRANAVAFHPSLPTIVTTGTDQMVRFWTTRKLLAGDDARLVGEFPLSYPFPKRLRFSDDGQSLYVLHAKRGISRLSVSVNR